MPELPEVETIARSLRNPRDLVYSPNGALDTMPGIVGRKIKAAQVFWAKSIAQPSVDEFSSGLSGQTIRVISRRGKFLVVMFERGSVLIHLRMSGDLRVEPDDLSVRNHDRVLIQFNDGMRLVFNDPRKFGRIWYVQDAASVLEKLGPEPLEDALDEGMWIEMLRQRNRQLKPLLLDQSFLAGLGNIYTDEALHRAGLHPLRKAGGLSEVEAVRLLAAIRQVLQEGIDRNGSSIDWVYRGGSFQNQFQVYQRDGEQCNHCGELIVRTVVGQRGTHYCPNCQPESPSE